MKNALVIGKMKTLTIKKEKTMKINEKIIVATEVINANDGLLNGKDGYVIGRFSNSSNLDKCFEMFIKTNISLFDISRDFDKNEIYVKV